MVRINEVSWRVRDPLWRALATGIVCGAPLTAERRHPRYSSSHEMDVTSATGLRKTYLTLDHGEGGMFVMAMPPEQLPIGAEVTITPTDDIRRKKASAIKGRVARVSKIGMGIEFVDTKST